MTKDRRQRKKANTKEQIFNVALELFLAKGYYETTVEEISIKADVAKGTFFNHFPNKDTILFYLGEKRNALLDKVLEEELKNIQSSKGKLFEYFRILARFNEEEKEITRLIVIEIFKNTSPQKIGEDDSMLKFRMAISKIIEEGKQQGEFRPDVNINHVADILVGIYFYTLFPWLEGKLSDSLTIELLERVELLMHGIKS